MTGFALSVLAAVGAFGLCRRLGLAHAVGWTLAAGYFYGIANPVIREAAARTETPLIDVASRFRPLCPKSECAELFFADHHPTAQGYRLVAETVRDALFGKGLPVVGSQGEAMEPAKEEP